MTIEKQISVYFLLIPVLLFSCNQHSHNETEERYKLSLNFQSGSKYYCTISSETETDFTVNGKKQKSSNSSVTGLLYEISNDSSGSRLLKITYDSFHIVAKKGGQEIVLDASNAPNSIYPVENILGKLKGSSLLINLNSKGEFISIAGYKEITDKIMSAVNIPDESQRQQAEAQISAVFGEGFIKNNFEQVTTIFPDTALYIGDSWTKQQKQLTELKLDLIAVYTLESVADSIAVIEGESKINNEDAQTDILGFNATVSVRGNVEESFKIDLRTGALISEKSSTTIEGTVQVNETEVPISINTTKEITMKRL